MRARALSASHSNPSLHHLTRHDDHALHLIGDECLRRPDVASLFARGSKAFMNVFQWTGAHETGWGVPEADLLVCERKESLSALYAENPPLWVHAGAGDLLRKIRPSDIFVEGSGAKILRLAISPILADITCIEVCNWNLQSSFKFHLFCFVRYFF